MPNNAKPDATTTLDPAAPGPRADRSWLFKGVRPLVKPIVSAGRAAGRGTLFVLLLLMYASAAVLAFVGITLLAALMALGWALSGLVALVCLATGRQPRQP